MANHTPLPWVAINRGTKDDPMMSVMAARIAGQPPRHEVAICATGDSPQEMENANAAFIVRAVNAHDALVAALDMIFEELNDNSRTIKRDGEIGTIFSTPTKIALANALSKVRGENL